MQRPKYQVADVIRRFGQAFMQQCHPNAYQVYTLDALQGCRTATMGGHKYSCEQCGKSHISYNSCRNRHCPKCQTAKQAFWLEDRINNMLPVKHYHMVFTLPQVLNPVCMLDSRWFYNHLFASVWETLNTFGYSHYGVEGGAISVLHTWGQNLSLHPHLHCIVPATGLNLQGKWKAIGNKGTFLYPVKMLSIDFRKKFLEGLKKHLVKSGKFTSYKNYLDLAWNKPWVVFCEPSFGKPKHVMGYLAQYLQRVAITNHRIVTINDQKVFFKAKDYRNHGKSKVILMDGVEFLRRFCLHILPKGFVKVRYFGIYSSRFKAANPMKIPKMIIDIGETVPERIKRLTGMDIHQCPFCRKGQMILTEILPRIRSPDQGLLPALIN